MGILISVFVFIIAAIFRLIDNSAGLLIANGISVSPFYLSTETIYEEIAKLGGSNKVLERKLKRNLIFRKIHKTFVVLSIITLIAGIIYEIYNPTLINLL